MATYSTSLKLTLIGDGEQSGTWGQTTNTNLGTLLEQAITGVVTIVHPDTATYSLTNLNGVSDEARNAVLVITGALTAQRDVIAPAVEKLYTIKNSTTGGYAIRIKTSGGTAVTVPNGFVIGVYCDGTDFYVQQNGIVGPFAVTGNATVVGTLGVVGALSGSTAAFSGAISSVSPTFTGTPTVPTATAGTNTTQAASTAFVQAAVTGATGSLGTMSTQNANNVNITGGSISGITDLALADGGTGASTAADARTNLGVTATGQDTTYAYRANNLSDLSSASSARTNLGLGTIATQNANNVNITGGSIAGITDLAIADGGTGASDAATARTNLGLGTIATQNSNSVTITGGSITGITDLAVADGGTGASSITANSVILGNGTSALSGNLVAPSTSGNVLTSNGTTWQSTANSYIGVGQTWQNPSRSLGVNYTNSTGKPIMVAVTTSNYFSYTYIYVDGNNIGYSYDADFGGRNLHTFIVPNGSTYQAAGSSGNTVLQLWWELR